MTTIINETPLKVWDRVAIHCRTWSSWPVPGTVLGFETNMLGMPLVQVAPDDSIHDTVFYPHELVRFEEKEPS